MQADEDTAEVARVMKSDALKTNATFFRILREQMRGQEHQHTRRLPVDEGHEMGEQGGGKTLFLSFFIKMVVIRVTINFSRKSLLFTNFLVW